MYSMWSVCTWLQIWWKVSSCVNLCILFICLYLVGCVSLVYVPVQQIGEEVDTLAQVYERILLFGWLVAIGREISCVPKFQPCAIRHSKRGTAEVWGEMATMLFQHFYMWKPDHGHTFLKNRCRFSGWQKPGKHFDMDWSEGGYPNACIYYYSEGGDPNIT